MMHQQALRQRLESVLFIADEPVATEDLAVLFEMPSHDVEILLMEMAEEFVQYGRGVVIRKVAGGWRLASHPGSAPYLERFVGERRGARLSQAALETLAIVAYRQPISRIQIAQIRGVSVDGVLKTLVGRGMVREVSKDPGPGQASLFGTTSLFLERMGLDALSELPPLADLMPDRTAVAQLESGLGPGL